jgi:mannose-6-phosphate isomerase-like protein (cupin superfamily)
MMTQTSQHAEGAAIARRGIKTGAGEGQAYWFFGGRTVIRSPEGARPVIIEMELGPGGHAPLHVHRNIDDSFYLLSGQIAVRCGEDTFVAGPGDYVSQPKGVPHTFFVLGDQPAVILQTHEGEDFLDFIRQAGIPATGPAPADQPGLDWLYQVADATGQPVTGPPMTAEEAARILAASSVG